MTLTNGCSPLFDESIRSVAKRTLLLWNELNALHCAVRYTQVGRSELKCVEWATPSLVAQTVALAPSYAWRLPLAVAAYFDLIDSTPSSIAQCSSDDDEGQEIPCTPPLTVLPLQCSAVWVTQHATHKQQYPYLLSTSSNMPLTCSLLVILFYQHEICNYVKRLGGSQSSLSPPPQLATWRHNFLCPTAVILYCQQWLTLLTPLLGGRAGLSVLPSCHSSSLC